jgi:outer membrane protein OmpA-like peptidoglycan-associated protein
LAVTILAVLRAFYASFRGDLQTNKCLAKAKELGFLMSKKKRQSVHVLTSEMSISSCPRSIITGVLSLAVMSLAGCTSVPNTINPAEWYKSTVNLLAGEDSQKKESGAQTDKEKVYQRGAQSNKAKNIPFGEGVIPKLSSVPKRPNSVIVKGLVPDNQKRKYAEPIARQGEISQMLAQQAPSPATQPRGSSVVTTLQKAAPAIPASPVISAQASQPVPTRSAVTYSSIQPKKFTLTPPTNSAPAMRATTLNSITDDPFTTVVVSSNGVDMKSSSAATGVSTQAQQIVTKSSAPNLKQVKAINGTKIATILFKTGSSGLSGIDRKIIGQVVQLHQQRGGKVTVVGHASSRTRNMDPVNHKMVNYGVSVNRADRIAKELRKMGMAPESIIVDARSDSMPLYYEIMPSGEAGNRRAEIYFNN